jgi:hypothetical protein
MELTIRGQKSQVHISSDTIAFIINIYQRPAYFSLVLHFVNKVASQGLRSAAPQNYGVDHRRVQVLTGNIQSIDLRLIHDTPAIHEFLTQALTAI